MHKSIVLIMTGFLVGAGFWPDASHWIQYPASDFGCNQMAAGPSGDVWFCDGRGKAIDSISPTGVVTAYPGVPNHEPFSGLAVGPDGNIWYGANFGGVVRMTPSGSLTYFRMPKGELVWYMTASPDGNLWTAGYNGQGNYHLSKISMTGQVTQYPPQLGNFELKSIVAGPDGNIWYVDLGGPTGSIVGRVTPGGVFTQFRTPHVQLYRIVPAKDGNLYASADGSKGVLAKVTPSGQITYIPGLSNMVNGFENLAEGPDGNVWGNIECFGFNECLAKYDVVSGSFFMTKIPRGPLKDIYTLVIAGPDRNIWIQPAHIRGVTDEIFEYLTGLR